MQIHILDAKFSGDPEAVAMLQAFYSRSTEGIQSRLTRLGDDMAGVKKALSKFYVGYGHASIVTNLIEWKNQLFNHVCRLRLNILV